MLTINDVFKLSNMTVSFAGYQMVSEVPVASQGINWSGLVVSNDLTQVNHIIYRVVPPPGFMLVYKQPKSSYIYYV